MLLSTTLPMLAASAHATSSHPLIIGSPACKIGAVVDWPGTDALSIKAAQRRLLGVASALQRTDRRQGPQEVKNRGGRGDVQSTVGSAHAVQRWMQVAW